MHHPLPGGRLRKPIESVRADHAQGALNRKLGAGHLILLGVGCIIGAGVYVMTGTVAAHHAGPAVLLSFLLAGTACGFTALCYAELAAALPVEGASYSYAYVALGEVFAWALGWMLCLEFGLSGAALAAGATGYLGSLLADFGVILSPAWSQPTLQAVPTPTGHALEVSGNINLVACLLVAFFAAILIRGVSQSARANAIMVFIKLAVLGAFVIIGAPHVNSANWHPFIPPATGGFAFGWAGILRGASILFFAYIGFEAVATAAAEARNPRRDVPIGILGALAVATLFYIAVAGVMTGLVPFRQLDVPDPVALALAAVDMPVMALIIKVGALTGLCSVLMVNTYAHSRVCLAMARDRLLPSAFGKIRSRFLTPHWGTAIVAAVAAAGAATLPMSVLGDLVSLGTGVVFLTVAFSVIWLRNNHPELTRPFTVPFGGVRIRGQWIGVTPVISILLTLAMVGPVLIDLTMRAIHGDWIPAAVLAGYIGLGASIYMFFGRRRSLVRLSVAH